MNLIETIENKLITLINKEAVYDIDGSNMNLKEIKVLTELLKVAKENSVTPSINNALKCSPPQYWHNNITYEKK